VTREVRLTWSGKDARPALVKAKRTKVAFRTAAGTLYEGNNLEVMRRLEKNITLAYLDPPFLTGRVHEIKNGEIGFDDRWTDRAEYLEALIDRIEAARELLLPHGSIVIHVDPKTSHYVKVLCDEIFGEDAFASEIVWRYRRWPSKTPNFQRVHDVLLRYRKDPRVPPRFNPLYEPLAPSTLATWGTGKQRAVFENGRRLRSSTMKQETPGVPMGDVWDIGVIAPVSKERTGYPSQKPEALLERLVTALTDPGEVVLDPYAGSGTTLAVAARLGRNFVGIDQSAGALDIATKRLRSACVEVRGSRTVVR
jgi:site-specific DNA-methyltransferase (adenine-specific)